MRKMTVFFGALLLAPTLAMTVVAQDANTAATTQPAIKSAEPPVHFYRLDFVLQQVGADGKPYNSRSYATTVSTGRSDPNTEIRTGSRIPFTTSGGKDGETVQYQYQDIGVNIDARSAHEAGSKLSLFLAADVTSVSDSKSATSVALPSVNQNKWQGQALILIGKPTVVFSSDDMQSKGAMQLVVTATLLQ